MIGCQKKRYSWRLYKLFVIFNLCLGSESSSSFLISSVGMFASAFNFIEGQGIPINSGNS